MSWPFKALLRGVDTLLKKKAFFLMLSLVAQKDSQKKLSMWDYLQVELYRFCYFFYQSQISPAQIELTVDRFSKTHPPKTICFLILSLVAQKDSYKKLSM